MGSRRYSRSDGEFDIYLEMSLLFLEDNTIEQRCSSERNTKLLAKMKLALKILHILEKRKNTSELKQADY